MIKNTYTIDLPHASVFKEGWCVVDIETEGRFWRTSKLLRACAITYGAPCTETEWIAEKEADEYDILAELSQVLKAAARLMTFNGNSFDLPHLRKKYQAYRASDPTNGRRSFDVMHELVPYQFLFHLDSYHLSDYLSLFRGRYRVRNDAEGALLVSSLLELSNIFVLPDAELTAIVADSTEHPASAEERPEVEGTGAHNYTEHPASCKGKTEEKTDTEGTGAPNYTEHPASCKGKTEEKTEEKTDTEGTGAPTDTEHPAATLKISWRLKINPPTDITLTDEAFYLETREGNAHLAISIYDGMLRRYFTDPANYDFLIAEGYAAHKSLTAYVAADRKTKAVRENCFSLIPVSSVYPERPDRLRKYVESVLTFLRRDINWRHHHPHNYCLRVYCPKQGFGN